MIELAWPAAETGRLLWSQCVLTWILANYAPIPEPVGRQELVRMSGDEGSRARYRRWIVVRSAAAALLTTLLPGLDLADLGIRLSMGGFTLGLCLALPFGRERLAKSDTAYRYSAEWEIVTNVAYLAGVGLIIGSRLAIADPLLLLPASTHDLIAANLVISAVLFSVGGGTHIVRGVLDKADTLPLREGGAVDAEGSTLDTEEYGRGQTIGNVERLLLLAMVFTGSYEALALLIAAKGLIRAQTFSDRDFAEYFIVGSLASILVAFVVGFILRAAL